MLRRVWIIGVAIILEKAAMAHSSIIPHAHPHATWSATWEGLGFGLFLAASFWVVLRIRDRGLNR